MRTLMIAAIVAAMAFGGSASAGQRIGPNGAPMAGGWKAPMPNPQPMPMQPRPMQPRPGNWNNGGQWNNNGGGKWNNNGGNWNRGGYRGNQRWGGAVGGYWYAGVQAPGGWNGYKAVKRGKRIPSYWLSSNFIIGDYNRYGLFAPQGGYYWTRYYNDALLIDRYGVVYDSRPGIDWGRYDGGYDDGYDDGYGYGGDDTYYATGGSGYDAGPGYGAPYPAPGYGGTSGSSSSYSYESSTGYNGGGYAPAPRPLPQVAPGYGPGPRPGYGGGTYYTPPGTTTTIVIPGATTTTTTTEIIEDTYVAKKVWRAPVKKWRPKPKPRPCNCGCCR